MINSYSRLTAIFLILLLTPFSAPAQQPSPEVSTLEAIKAEFDAVPCKDGERLAAVRALFEKLGATEADFTLEKYKQAENFIVRKPGKSPETIIIGAHYDKVTDGCGAIDNWSGIVAVAHIYRTLKNVPTQKNILFVAFGNEEKGLFGSQAMVRAIEKEHLGQYCGMINIDSLGMARPQVLDNASSKKMIELAENLAKEMKMPFGHASVAGADADSSSFVARKIPAVTIHGLSNDWRTVLHSRNDQASRVNETSVYLGYRLALSVLVRVDQSACADFR